MRGPSTLSKPSLAMGRLRAFACICLALALAISFIPITALSPAEATPAWVQDIPDMLATGEYVEGEVVACINETAAAPLADDNVETEAIMEIATRSSIASGLTVVRSDTLSTEELLYELAKNPSVIFAEPNYTGIELALDVPMEDKSDNEQQGDDPEVNEMVIGKEAAGQEPDDAITPMDQARALLNGNGATASATSKNLNAYQWGYVNDSSTLQTPGVSNTASVNPPNWNGADGNMGGQKVVVAVLDGGIDVNHPDLDDAIYRFTPAQQQALGCGEFGFNAEAVANPTLDATDVTDIGHHGTHCAGIIASEWNGAGTSGIASDAQIMVIKNGDASTSIVDQLNAYAFIKRAVLEQGINVKVTSNSWVVLQSTRSIDAAVRDLGETCGIVSIFGAGNWGLDNDTNLFSGTVFKDNPYAAVIAATSTGDKLWKQSHYGATTVDLATPGGSILSTVPFAEARYFPDMSDDGTNLVYDGYDATTKAIRIGAVALEDGKEVVTAFDDANYNDTSAYLTGSGCFSATLNKPMASSGANRMQVLEFDATNVPSPDAQSGASFGMALYCTSTIAPYSAKVKLVDGSWQDISDDEYMAQKCLGESWDFIDLDLPTNTDLDNFQLRITFITDGTPQLMIDSVGIGTQKVPYDFLSGTSMATPAAAGACAVLAAQYPQDTAVQRIARLKATVRSNASLEGITTTGGVLDLSVPSSTISCNPVIDSFEASGNTAVISGSYFGQSEGTVALSDGSTSGGSTFQTTIESWSDTSITLHATDTLTGTVDVRVTASDGRSSHRSFFIDSGARVYEHTRSLPESTGDPYAIDNYIDCETSGILQPLQGYLYSLPYAAEIEESSFVQPMWRYDIASDSWTSTTALPEPLTNVSATLWDGLLVVKGTSMEVLPSGVPRVWAADSDKAKSRIYAYDPSANTWSEVPASNVRLGSTLVNADGTLMLIGGNEGDDSSTEISSFDPTSGNVSHVGELSTSRVNPVAIASDDAVYVYDSTNDTLEVVRNGTGTVLENAFPEFKAGADDSRSFAAISGGIAMVGPLSADGTTDTYMLYSGGTSFEPHFVRLSNTKVLAPTITTYDGQLFAIASSSTEPDGRVFRSTKSVTTSCVPGDVARTTSSFDLRDEGLVTPVRNQGNADVCLSFATIASLESTTLRKTGETIDLSPFQMLYFAQMGTEEREANGVNEYMPDNPYGGGYLPIYLAGSLAAGKGAARLQEGVNDGTLDMDESQRYASDVRLTDTTYINSSGKAYWEEPSPDELQQVVKNAIENKGPVVIEFLSSFEYSNYNSETGSYYISSSMWNGGADHSAVIIGWDDSYSRFNFSEWQRPYSDGAWLVKNSWGEDFGNDGYCWISYEDASLGFIGVFEGEQTRADESIYQKDIAGWRDSLSVDGTGSGYAANIFTSERNEKLDRVMLCTTGIGATYQVDIYRGIVDGANPRSGELVSTQKGSEEQPGYHTIELDTSVALTKGDTFSVVVSMENASYAYPIAVEAFTPDPEMPNQEPRYMGYDDEGNPETSYVSTDGENWENPAGYGHDLATKNGSLRSMDGEQGASGRDHFVTNVCVKALTVPASASGDESGSGDLDGSDTSGFLSKTGDWAWLIILAMIGIAATAVILSGATRHMRAKRG